MAKVQNTFIKSRMNKDLDDRLLSNGEYRNAQNVNVSRSEGEDVGALENVLGNKLTSNFGLSSISGLTTLGSYMDEANERVFAFLTNYVDTSTDELSNQAPSGASCYIVVYNAKTDLFQTLVQGSFLNLSSTHPVLGVDLIEDLLFWTDNRNQPRKINVNSAIASSSYYSNEDQISVAKYYPYNSPYLYDFILDTASNSVGSLSTIELAGRGVGIFPGMFINFNTGTFQDQTENHQVVSSSINGSGVTELILSPDLPSGFTLSSRSVQFYGPSSTNVTDEFLTPSLTAILSSNSASINTINISATATGGGTVKVGMELNSPGTSFTSPPVLVTAVNASSTLITLNQNVTLDQYQWITFSSPNPYYNSAWPGDKEFLSDRFVRFSYRFKFDDGEYSLIAPFTQPAFIPKQDGYITQSPNASIDTWDDEPTNGYARPYPYVSQENEIGESTIVSFFENKVDNVSINIDTPYAVNQLDTTLKVDEIDILYKESDGLAIKVLESIPVTDAIISSNSTKVLTYDYQSRRPIKVLPDTEVTRVFDKVPVRAKAQSTSGNRIIYGNFIDQHTPPSTLSFAVLVSPKINVFEKESNYSTVSYPNHNLKQNRTYQVGIVLSDRYGRQSDVVLSSVSTASVEYPNGSANFFSGSTIYNSYSTSSVSPTLIDWFGDSLKVLFESPIPTTVAYADGYPGLYSSNEIILNYNAVLTAGASTTFTIAPWNTNIVVGTNISGIDSSNQAFSSIISSINTSSNTITIPLALTMTATGTLNMSAIPNTLGWYSYKIVVKQVQQDYYNVYVPNILSGNPQSTESSFSESYITLITDNINKIPSDLTAVQPEQTQFRTSDEILYPRVGGVTSDGIEKTVSSRQYYPEPITSFVTVSSIGKVIDLGIANTVGATGEVVKPTTALGVFDAKSNPTVARLNVNNSPIGFLKTSKNWLNESPGDDGLGVLEVKPPESAIDIYWETSTSGLISELNAAIAVPDTGVAVPPAGIEDGNGNNTVTSGVNALINGNAYTQNENTTGGTFITQSFSLVDENGLVLTSQSILDLVSVKDLAGNSLTVGDWELYGSNPGSSWRLKTDPNSSFVYINDASNPVNYVFNLRATSAPGVSPAYTNIPLVFNGFLANSTPVFINQPDTLYRPTLGTEIFSLPAGSVLNGSVDGSRNQFNVELVVVTQSNVPYPEIFVLPSNSNNSQSVVRSITSNSSAVSGTYKIRARDADGGIGYAETFSNEFDVEFT